MDNSYNDLLAHHRKQLEHLYQYCQTQLPFNSTQASDSDNALIESLKILKDSEHCTEEFIQLGQSVITRIVGNYPQITPKVDRDLFWFFGGDCLHFMSDEELTRYQQLDELLYQQQVDGRMNFSEAKAAIFKLH